jgi:hypothetical protein
MSRLARVEYGRKDGLFLKGMSLAKTQFGIKKPAYKNDFISIIPVYYWYDEDKERMFYLCSEFE